jgi:hypothetical protein
MPMSRGDPEFYDDEPPKGSLRKFYACMAEVPGIEKKVKEPRSFSWKYEVPYLAGISNDGKMVYLDPKLKGLPKWAIQAIIFHEIIEKALEATGLGYEARHHMATAAEDQFVAFQGHTPESYRKLMRPFYRLIEDEEVETAPPDLDLAPYDGKLKTILESFQ